MLHIFGRDAWGLLDDYGQATLNLSLTTSSARVRVLAEWDNPGPRSIDARYCNGHGTNEPRRLRFHAFARGVFTGWETPTSRDSAIKLSSPFPPDRLQFSESGGQAASMTAGVLPACLDPCGQESWNERPVFDLAAQVSEKLRDGNINAGIGLFAYSRSGLPEAEIVAAAREVFAYLARYPLQRDPLLGAFLASLCGEAAVR